MVDVFSARLTSKGQITIPKKLREHLGLKEGSVIDFSINDEGQVIMSLAKMAVIDLGYRVFFKDKDDNYFECYADKARKSVPQEWLNENMKNSRTNGFKAIIIDEKQVSHIKQTINHSVFNRFLTEESVQFFHTLGLITDEDFVVYHQHIHQK